LLNTQGQLIQQTDIDHPGAGFDHTMYIRQKLPAGMYYLQILHHNEKYNLPVFVQ
jgi:hypothetical protein